MTPEDVQDDANSRNDFLLFRYANESYGTSLLDVNEVIEPQAVKPMPNAADHFSGVINLRGQIVGLIDLRVKFGLEAKAAPTRRALLVYSTPSGIFGIEVDAVIGVGHIPEVDIDRAPRILTKVPANFLVGIGKFNGGLVTLIDVQKLLEAEEILSFKRSKFA